LGRDAPIRFSNRPGYEFVGLAVENLRLYCPPALPVTVRAGKSHPRMDGYCTRRGDKFFIEIDHALGREELLNVLVHEWAHARGWNFMLEKAADDFSDGNITQEQFEAISHGPEFGVAFAEVWRAFVKYVIPALKSHAF
jgi:hypothetical protein